MVEAVMGCIFAGAVIYVLFIRKDHFDAYAAQQKKPVDEDDNG